MAERVLIVAAHADDEALGCGGTIARHVARGDEVYAVFLADGVSSRPQVLADDRRKRQLAAGKAQEILGIRQSWSLGFPDNRLDSLPLLEVVQPLENILGEVAPQRIYTHHHGDLNIDHQVTHRAVLTACRPLPSSPIRAIYGFEVLSATEWNTPDVAPFLPTVFVDVSDFVETKLQALAAYGDEMRESPHSRSMANVRHQLAYRGHSVGLAFAEAFSLIRWIEK